MSGSSIILDPQHMFQTLRDLQDQTIHLLVTIHTIEADLQTVATLTFATGFDALMKKAEADINRVGSAAVAANNAFRANQRIIFSTNNFKAGVG